MATVGELLAAGTDRLRAAGSPSARLDAELLLADVLGTDRTGCWPIPSAPRGTARRRASRRRSSGAPPASRWPTSAASRSSTAWRSSTDARALMPRPETELLVDLALAELADVLGRAPRPAGTPPVRVADVGTGSGAIAVAIAAALRRLRDGRRGRDRRVGPVGRRRCARPARTRSRTAWPTASGSRLPTCCRRRAPRRGCSALRSGSTWSARTCPTSAPGDLAGLPPPVRFEPPEALDGGPDGLAVIRRLLAVPAGSAERGRAGAPRDRLGPGGGPWTPPSDRALPGWGCEVVADLAGLPRIARVVGDPPARRRPARDRLPVDRAGRPFAPDPAGGAGPRRDAWSATTCGSGPGPWPRCVPPWMRAWPSRSSPAG